MQNFTDFCNIANRPEILRVHFWSQLLTSILIILQILVKLACLEVVFPKVRFFLIFWLIWMHRSLIFVERNPSVSRVKWVLLKAVDYPVHNRKSEYVTKLYQILSMNCPKMSDLGRNILPRKYVLRRWSFLVITWLYFPIRLFLLGLRRVGCYKSYLQCMWCICKGQ